MKSSTILAVGIAVTALTACAKDIGGTPRGEYDPASLPQTVAEAKAFIARTRGKKGVSDAPGNIRAEDYAALFGDTVFVINNGRPETGYGIPLNLIGVIFIGADGRYVWCKFKNKHGEARTIEHRWSPHKRALGLGLTPIFLPNSKPERGGLSPLYDGRTGRRSSTHQTTACGGTGTSPSPGAACRPPPGRSARTSERRGDRRRRQPAADCHNLPGAGRAGPGPPHPAAGPGDAKPRGARRMRRGFRILSLPALRGPVAAIALAAYAGAMQAAAPGPGSPETWLEDVERRLVRLSGLPFEVRPSPDAEAALTCSTRRLPRPGSSRGPVRK